MKTYPVAKRLLSEFWIPVVIALVWAVFRVWFEEKPSWAWVTFVTNFVGALFLVSWFTGQFVRIKRQQGVEQSLSMLLDSQTKAINTITANQEEITAKFSALTEKIVAALNAGLSVPTEMVTELANTNAQFAQSNNNIAEVLHNMSGLAWEAILPDPGRPPRSPESLGPASTGPENQ